MAPKFSKPSSFAHMAPPRGAGRSGYKKHGDEDASQPVHEPSSSSAQPASGHPDGGEPNDGSSSDDKPSSGDGFSDGGDDFPEGEPPSDDEGDDDGIEETSEEESGTDDEIVNPEVDDLKSKCAMLEKEVAMLENELEKVGKMSQAFFLTIQQGFHRGRQTLGREHLDGNLPDDRLELLRLVEKMTQISQEADLKKLEMMDVNRPYAFYIYHPELRQTKVIYLNPKSTIKQMKVMALQKFSLPKVFAERFSWFIREGYLLDYYIDLAIPTQWNRKRVKSVVKDTCRIEMTSGITGGGKSGGVSAMSVKKVITATRKQERMECVVKQDLSKITSADKVVEAVNGAMTHLFDKVEQGEANVVFEKLLRSLPDTVLGNEKESEILKCLDASSSDVRLEKTIDLFLKALYPALFSMKAEIDTTIEGASLTLEFLLSEGFIKESNGKWAWKDVKKAVLDEVKRREIIQNAGEGDSDVEMLSATVATLTTG